MIFKTKSPTANHRFLHSLVFSSVLILEGCAAGAAGTPASVTAQTEIAAPVYAAPVHATPAASSRPPTSTPAPSGLASSGLASSGTPASGLASTGAPASGAPASGAPASGAPASGLALDDARYCERGWPTTKAGGGNSFNACETTLLDDGTERIECLDQDGPCVRR